MMGLTVHQTSSSAVEVTFSSMRRGVINVALAVPIQGGKVRVDLPPPDRMTGTYRTLMIVRSNVAQEPEIYLMSEGEARVLGHGEKEYQIAGERQLRFKLDFGDGVKETDYYAEGTLAHIVKMI